MKPQSLGLLLLVVTVVGGIIWAFIWDAKRRRAVIEAGAEIGFIEIDPDAMKVSELPLFNRRAGVELAMEGSAGGYEATLFEVRFPKGKSSEHVTFIAFKADSANLPLFQAHARNWTDKISSLFSSEVVHFPEAPAFEEAIVVRGADSEQVRTLFTPDLQSYVRSMPDEWSIEGYLDTLALYIPKTRQSASALRGFVEQASSIAQGFLAFSSRTSHHFGD